MDYIYIKAVHVAFAMVFVGGLTASALTLAFLETPRAGARLDALRRLRLWDRLVTGPSLVAVWLIGIYLATVSGQFSAPWLSIKLVFVIALSALHGVFARNLRLSLAEPARPAPRWLRYAPAFVAVSVTAIAILAVAKPL